MEDFSKNFRKKNKFVFELRYHPFLRLLDEQGKLIDKIHKDIDKVFPHWQIANSEIVFSDNLEITKSQFLVGLKRMSLLVEDTPTFESFYDNVMKYTKIFFGVSDIKTYLRIGCRLISLYESKEQKNNYDFYLKKIENIYLKEPLNLGLKHSDLLIRIIHNNGMYQIGPVKGEEGFVKSNFVIFQIQRKFLRTV
ncbi:MAG: hypothetical protein Ta2B_15610 [Termitinemataceae bacterium]|nr:MAG: hypothetical protein Ta2B_15610 [Termitinemataceae bacterium]